jgi:chorismate mutase/prephenate dehydratase
MRDEQGLAVANKGAAQVYGLKIFEDRLAPPSKNITRFLLVGDRKALLPTFYNKTGLVRGMLHLRLVNRSGALCDALLVFKKHGVNLTQILSRPVAGSPGSHQFLIEWEGAAKEPTMPWLKELKDVTRTCSSLGIYKVRDVPSATLKK